MPTHYGRVGYYLKTYCYIDGMFYNDSIEELGNSFMASPYNILTIQFSSS